MTPTITLTGADERTQLDALANLAELGAEIGLLYTFDPEGRHRYPSAARIAAAAQHLKGRAALHVCGTRAKEQLRRGELKHLTDGVRRVQINGRIAADDLGILCEMLDGHTIITQHTDANLPLLDIAVPNHALLVDGSGGRGLLPPLWVRPLTDKPVGFAGGLKPGNLLEELPKIASVARGEWWIDLESGLRDAEDWFSVKWAAYVLGLFDGWVDQQKGQACP